MVNTKKWESEYNANYSGSLPYIMLRVNRRKKMHKIELHHRFRNIFRFLGLFFVGTKRLNNGQSLAYLSVILSSYLSLQNEHEQEHESIITYHRYQQFFLSYLFTLVLSFVIVFQSATYIISRFYWFDDG